MRFLLDTHVLLWALARDKRLKRETLHLLQGRQHEIFVSAVSFWEIVVKHSLGKVDLALDRLELAVKETGLHLLDITSRHALGLAQLPLHHKDPFDRMLISQCMVESLLLITADKALEVYGSTVRII